MNKPISSPATSLSQPSGKRKLRWSRRGLLRFFWLALAVALLWLTLRTVELGAVWARLSQLQPGQLLLLFAVNLLVLATFSARWWLLLFAQGYRVPYPALMVYRLATFAVSYFTPGPHFGGEPLQVYLVTARHGVPAPVSVAAVVLDKVLEMLANFTFLALGAFVVVHYQLAPGAGDSSFVAIIVLLLLVPIGVLGILAAGWHPVSRPLAILDGYWQRVRQWRGLPVQPFTAGRAFQATVASEEQCTWLCRRHPWILVAALGASAISWFAIMGEFWYMTGVLGLDLTFVEAMVALLAARLAILLPLPAALGALEASQVLAMQSIGLPAADGVSLSLLIRGRDVLLGVMGLVIAAGLLGWWKRKA
ncbi:MAG: flippase-like domain-containing protein [Anaerolineales bacterium]|nr:flippase-like domain-containing protein [Anaerolineales bacterium]